MKMLKMDEEMKLPFWRQDMKDDFLFAESYLNFWTTAWLV
jgi:hypothetical protein